MGALRGDSCRDLVFPRCAGSLALDKPALLRRLLSLRAATRGRSFPTEIAWAASGCRQHDYPGSLPGAARRCRHGDRATEVRGRLARQRGSSPKFQVYNNALLSAASGLTFDEARADRAAWGRLTESAVGAHLANAAATGICQLSYWRERNQEVDYVVRRGKRVTAIEVKSGRPPETLPGMSAFSTSFKPQRTLLVGGDGIATEEFLARPVRALDCMTPRDLLMFRYGKRINVEFKRVDAPGKHRVHVDRDAGNSMRSMSSTRDRAATPDRRHRSCSPRELRRLEMTT